MTFEACESRRLLSSSVSNGVLTVSAGNGNDAIDVRVTAGKLVVTENGQVTGRYDRVRSYVINAAGGNDTVLVNANVAVSGRLNGGSGNDTLTGGNGNTVINGDAGRDALVGRAGKDALLGGADADTLDGGLGDDYLDGGDRGLQNTVTYANRTGPVSAELGWYGEEDDNFVFYAYGEGGQKGEKDSYRNVCTLIGTSGNDSLDAVANYGFSAGKTPPASFALRLDGGAGNDNMSVYVADPYGSSLSVTNENFTPTLNGGTGDDNLGWYDTTSATLRGEDGNDRFVDDYGENAAPVALDGGRGSDTLVMRATVNRLPATFENAVIQPYTYYGTSGEYYGNDSDNTFTNRTGDPNFRPTIYLGAGDDTLTYEGTGVVEAFGEAGNDTLSGGVLEVDLEQSDGNTLSGGDGDDVLHGSVSKDVLSGDNGNDTLYGSDAADVLRGGDGNDSLNGGNAADALFGDNGDDLLVGQAGRDYLEGNSGNDRLYGGSDNDTLDGGTGNDRLYGEAGNDTLYAQDGQRDYLYGGPGSDRARRDDVEVLLDSVEARVTA